MTYPYVESFCGEDHRHAGRKGSAGDRRGGVGRGAPGD